MALFRIPEPQGYDRIACLTCGAVGDYEEVVKGGAGLIGGGILPEELVDLRRKAGFTPK
jgi:hypothetical protein